MMVSETSEARYGPCQGIREDGVCGPLCRWLCYTQGERRLAGQPGKRGVRQPNTLLLGDSTVPLVILIASRICCQVWWVTSRSSRWARTVACIATGRFTNQEITIWFHQDMVSKTSVAFSEPSSKFVYWKYALQVIQYRLFHIAVIIVILIENIWVII